MSLGAPYTDIRIDRLALPYVLNLPGLYSIQLYPPASGPEIELTFATAHDCEPASQGDLENEVVRVCGYEPLAVRRRAEPGPEVAEGWRQRLAYLLTGVR